MTSVERNWAGSFAFTATQVHQPASLDELRAIVARAPRIHVLGSRHSFNGIADAAELVSLERLSTPIEINRQAMNVTVDAGIRYGELCLELERAGLALHNMASLPHVTVAGAIATATHGSGDRNGNLATAVKGLELVTSDGEVRQVARGDDDFAGMVVHLGALGAVSRLTLDVQPSYLVRQEVFEDLAWDVLYAEFDAVMSSADSVSLFTGYGDTAGDLWCKTRVDPERAWERRTEHFGARAAVRSLHPVPLFPADSCTDQLGEPGPWNERLPHFRMDGIASAGNELQSEYMVPREFAVDAIQAVRALGPRVRPVLLVAEIRTVAADDLWMSTAYGRDTVCLHFTWKPGQVAVEALLPTLEAALTPYSARPHWGKLFAATAAELEPRYERMAEFRALAKRLDPRGAFRNEFLERHVLGK